MDSGSPNLHQDNCLNHALSKILRWRFNRSFDDSWNDTWTHKDALIKIERAKKLGDVGSWPTDFAQSQPLIVLQANSTVRIFRGKFPIK